MGPYLFLPISDISTTAPAHPVGTLACVGFVDRLLNDDEELLQDVRPHPVVLFGPLLLFAAALAGAVTIGDRFPQAPVEVVWLLAAMVVLPALWLLGRVMRWRGVHFLVTPNRLLYKRGVLGRDVLQLRLQRVAEVHCHQSLFGRLGGWGTVIFEISSGDEPLVVEDARRPRSLQRLVTAQLDRQGTAPRAPTSRPTRRPGRVSSDTPPAGVPVARAPRSRTPGSGSAEAMSVPAQLLQLDELRRRGVLTDAEFSAKKAELLSRL